MSSPPRPSAVLFDFDGTLVDSQRDIAEAVNAALVSVSRDRLALDAILPMIGDGARVLVTRALGADATNAALVERTLSAFQDAYASAPYAHTTLLPGAREALALAVPHALVTNKPRAITLLVLEGLGLRDAFGDAIYAGGDGPLKPNPNGVLRMAEALGVPPTGAWLIGDGPQDVLAGHAAGCFTIAVPGIADREHVLAARPHLVVDSLHDVARLAAASLSA